MQDLEGPITAKAEHVRAKFQGLLDKTNKENPSPKDVKALSDLLSDNRRLELWRDVASAGYLAELMVIENAHATAALKECWKHRLQVMKKDLGNEGAPMLEPAFNTTRCFVLAQAESGRAEVLECNEAVYNTYTGNLFGEAINSRSETIHQSLRDSCSG